MRRNPMILWVWCWSSVMAISAGVRLPLTVTEEAGYVRTNGTVTSGVPFPQGRALTNCVFQLLDAEGREVPLQSRVTATWRDGSVKWVLLDFQARLGARESRRFTLVAKEPQEPSSMRRFLAMTNAASEIEINTGPLAVVLSRNHPGILHSAKLDLNENGKFDEEPSFLDDALAPSLVLEPKAAVAHVKVLPPEELVIEENGPLRAVVKALGWITDGGTNRLVQYITRLTAFSQSPQLAVQHTIVQLSDTHKLLGLLDHSVALPLALGGPRQYAFGGNQTAHTGQIPAGGSACLTQLVEDRYQLRLSGEAEAQGLKAPGWVTVQGTRGGVLVAVEQFSQQFPKTIEVSPAGLRIGLLPREAGKAFDLDQGLAKTHAFRLTLYPGELTPERGAEESALLDHPLFAIAPTQWYCDTRVFGELQPFDFDLFPDYETLTEASGDQFIKRMATGWRNWGDIYYGGEYKGTNSYTNLEYDMHHNFLVQFARTGLRKYLDTAKAMAQHQADIDTNHKTGWQWKHSPRHTEIQAEFGHTFTRGLLETHFLTGNQRCLEAALELGDYFTRDIANPRALGNERQIGWALISLLPVYEATWDRKYLEAARHTVERLLGGLEATGKFSIRWDNRIAFFNGIAATGFIYYYRATGDERVAEAALRVIRRARGFYPEYNGRTLEAIAWAYQRTREPEWLDFLARTWETTLERQLRWKVMELGAPTIFTVHALPFLAQSGLLPMPDGNLNLTPAQFDTANGLFAHHLPSDEADLYAQKQTGGPLDLVVVRKGAWTRNGTVLVYDPDGRVQTTLEFPRENQLWQRKRLTLPNSSQPGIYRLVFHTPPMANGGQGSSVTWDVVSSQAAPVVFSTPDYRSLELVTPALYTIPRTGSSMIELELSAEGEGFKRAVIYDPEGVVAGSTVGFIDLGDKRRHHYKVSADIPPHQRKGIWSLSLQDMALDKLTGLESYFATSKTSFFRLEGSPER